MIAALLFAVLVIGACAPRAELVAGEEPRQTPRVEARTGDGRFVARIERAAGQENVSEALARYRLNVSEVRMEGAEAKETVRWSVLYPFEDEPARFVLAPGGRAFAETRERFREGRMVLSVQTAGGRTTWTGGELEISRDELGGDQRDQWLDPARELTAGWVDGPFGPRLDLTIPMRTRELHVDALLGRTVPGTVPSISPAAGPLPVRCAVPYVRSVEVPRVVSTGGPIEVEIVANHATPNWTFLGFELEIGEEGPRRVLHLTPRFQAPDGIQAQVLSVFKARATITGLVAGRYELRVEGWSPGGPPLTLDVRPARLVVGLTTRGGFAGVSQRYELFDYGLLRRQFRGDQPAEFVELDAARAESLSGLVAALPDGDRRAKTEHAADLFEHALIFPRGARWFAIDVDDLSATAAERALIDALRGG